MKLTDPSDPILSIVVIVNELLTYEKLAAGLHTLELAPAAILAFVTEMVKEFTIPAEAKNIALEINQGTHMFTIMFQT